MLYFLYTAAKVKRDGSGGEAGNGVYLFDGTLNLTDVLLQTVGKKG